MIHAIPPFIGYCFTPICIKVYEDLGPTSHLYKTFLERHSLHYYYLGRKNAKNVYKILDLTFKCGHKKEPNTAWITWANSSIQMLAFKWHSNVGKIKIIHVFNHTQPMGDLKCTHTCIKSQPIEDLKYTQTCIQSYTCTHIRSPWKI